MRPLVALLVSPLLLTGCARAALQYGHDGLAPVDRLVRARLEAGQYGSAYEAVFDADAAVRDRLLRALAAGTLGLYASRTDSSVWALDRAWALSEDRWSKRAGNAAASLVVNDYVLPYTPGPTERLFIPFYGALSWLSRGERDEAAVEARRLTQLLGIAPEDSGSVSAAGEVRGLLHYVAGAVFEAAGDRTAAEVAYRNAARLAHVPVNRDTTVADALTGDVVVVLEQGFVGHPVPRDQTVWLSRDEFGALRVSDDERSRRAAHGILVREGMRAFRPYDARPRYEMGVSINWSEFADGRPVASVVSLSSLGTGGLSGAAALVPTTGNVSRAVRADFERGQAARFTRALIRAAGRATLVKAAGDQLAKADEGERRRTGRRDRRDAAPAAGGGARGGARVGEEVVATADPKHEDDEKSSTVGRVLAGIGLFAIAAASEVNDRPDLRSWNLLPHDLRVVRLRLPVGEQDVRAVVDGREIIVGHALVRAGQVTVLSRRLFRAPPLGAAIAGAW